MGGHDNLEIGASMKDPIAHELGQHHTGVVDEVFGAPPFRRRRRQAAAGLAHAAQVRGQG
jgi:hypothetical protein